MTDRRYELTDEQWEKIKDFIPRARTGRPPKDNRMMLNAILWIMRSGASWADMPKCYGAYQTVYSRFCIWRDEEILEKIFRVLSAGSECDEIFMSGVVFKVPKLYD